MTAEAVALAVAREHGVTCDEAVRIAAGSNVLVHLRSARVMTGTAQLHADPASARARGRGEAYVEALLAGYGGAGDLASFLRAHALYDVIWPASQGMERAAVALARLR